MATNSQGSCKASGPGPRYMLPPTVGYEGHDITKDRGPAYSMASRYQKGIRDTGPGPSIMVEKYDRFGKIDSPAFTIAPLLKTKNISTTPGPDYYLPLVPRDAPAFSLRSRTVPPSEKPTGPGPNAYVLPGTLNGKVDHLGRRLPIFGETNCSPGPGKYHAPLPRKGPLFSFGLHLAAKQDTSKAPGPATYLPEYNTYRNAPMYSFGMKHSECKAVPLTDADKFGDCVDVD